MTDIEKILSDMDEEVSSVLGDHLDEQAFFELFNKHLSTYQILMKDCTQAQLDAFNEQYEWFYPFFQSMQDHVESVRDSYSRKEE